MLLVDERYLPVTITVPGMTDEKFRELCERYEDYFLECSADGEVTISAPRDPEVSAINLEIGFQLHSWAHEVKRGMVTDSSAGFLLPNGARRSADGAWISDDHRHDTEGCPEFLFELVSTADRPNPIRAKMREWIENGARLAWMIDLRTHTVTIYRPNHEPDERIGVTEVAGEGPVEGFVLNLRPVWNLDEYN